MDPATLSAAAAAAGALLTPLRDVSLGKLIEYFWDKLSSSSPSSSGEVKILQQLEEALEALKAANQNVKLMQTRNTRFLLEHKQNKLSVVSLHKQLEDVNSEIKDLESDFEDIKLQRRMEEINKSAEADITSQSSIGSKRLLPFYRQTVESRENKRQLSTSIQSLNLLTDDGIVRKITSIAKQISLITSMMTDEIKLVECFATGYPRDHFTQNMCGTTSSLPNERISYGTQNMRGTTSSLPNQTLDLSRMETSYFKAKIKEILPRDVILDDFIPDSSLSSSSKAIPLPRDVISSDTIFDSISNTNERKSLDIKVLPNHLKSLPSSIPILEGYKWIFVNGGWTLVPSINSDKFYLQVPSSPITPLDVPSDEEFLEWGEDEDFTIDEIVEGNHFLSEENLSHLAVDQLPEDLVNAHLSDFEPSLLNGSTVLAEISTEKIPTNLPPELLHTDSTTHPNIQKQIRKSDRPKKPSRRWNEEAGFIPHPPRSTKKKVGKNLR